MNTLIKWLNRSLIISAERPNHLTPLPRCLNTTSILFESKSNVITRKLGIPDRPKKPLTGFIRFMNEIRPTLVSSAKSQKEIPVLAAAQWKKLDESQKKKYNVLFEKENEIFRKKKETYEKSLTKEQKLAMKDERIRLKELKEENAKRAELKSRLRELGKPKRPKNAFLLYYIDENSKGKTTIHAVKPKYEALNDTEKMVYKQKAAALIEDYRNAMQAWEKRMVAKGLVDLVRRKKNIKHQTNEKTEH